MTRAIDVVADANVVLKWFRTTGEGDVEASRGVLKAHRGRTLAIVVLDLTFYEVGNVLLRGRSRASAEQTATVLDALRTLCPSVSPDAAELRRAAVLAERHRLTLYDATYAAVAQARSATLVTFDQALLDADLGVLPCDVLDRLSHRAG